MSPIGSSSSQELEHRQQLTQADTTHQQAFDERQLRFERSRATQHEQHTAADAAQQAAHAQLQTDDESARRRSSQLRSQEHDSDNAGRREQHLLQMRLSVAELANEDLRQARDLQQEKTDLRNEHERVFAERAEQGRQDVEANDRQLRQEAADQQQQFEDADAARQLQHEQAMDDSVQQHTNLIANRTRLFGLETTANEQQLQVEVAAQQSAQVQVTVRAATTRQRSLDAHTSAMQASTAANTALLLSESRQQHVESQALDQTHRNNIGSLHEAHGRNLIEKRNVANVQYAFQKAELEHACSDALKAHADAHTCEMTRRASKSATDLAAQTKLQQAQHDLNTGTQDAEQQRTARNLNLLNSNAIAANAARFDEALRTNYCELTNSDTSTRMANEAAMVSQLKSSLECHKAEVVSFTQSALLKVHSQGQEQSHEGHELVQLVNDFALKVNGRVQGMNQPRPLALAAPFEFPFLSDGLNVSGLESQTQGILEQKHV